MKLTFPGDLVSPIPVDSIFNGVEINTNHLFSFNIEKSFESYKSQALLELDELGLILKKDLLPRGIELRYTGMKIKGHVNLMDYTCFLFTPEHNGSVYFITMDDRLLKKLISELWKIKESSLEETLKLDAISELANILFGFKIILVRQQWRFMNDIKIPQAVVTRNSRLFSSAKNIYYKQVFWKQECLTMGMLS